MAVIQVHRAASTISIGVYALQINVSWQPFIPFEAYVVTLGVLTIKYTEDHTLVTTVDRHE